MPTSSYIVGGFDADDDELAVTKAGHQMTTGVGHSQAVDRHVQRNTGQAPQPEKYNVVVTINNKTFVLLCKISCSIFL